MIKSTRLNGEATMSRVLRVRRSARGRIAVALPDMLEQMRSPPCNAKNKTFQMTANFDVPASADLRRFWRAPSKHS
jgi:hypothetical protein